MDERENILSEEKNETHSKEDEPIKSQSEQFKSEKNDTEKTIIVNAEAYKTIILYATRYANALIPRENWKEVYGVLIGYMTDDVIVVEKAEPMTSGEATDVELSTEHYTFIEEINNELFSDGEKRNFLVGWFHTHPGLGLFYSFVDIKNQLGFQGPNVHSFGLVFDHTYLINQEKHPNHPGFEIYRLNIPEMDINDPRFDTNYHKVKYKIVGLNEFFFANVLTELSAYATSGDVLQKSYGEHKVTHNRRLQKKKDAKGIVKDDKTAKKTTQIDKSSLEDIPGKIKKIDKPKESKELSEEEIKLKETEKKIFDGKMAFVTGDSFTAIESYNAAIKILDDFGAKYSTKILKILNDITETCLKSNHDNLTLEFAEKLKKKAEYYGDLFYMGNADFFQGTVLIIKEEIQKGLEILENASILFEKSMDFAGMGRVNHSIGDIYLKEKNFDTAGLFYIEALKGYKKGIKNFHPKRRTTWSLAINLRNLIRELKKKVDILIPRIESKEIRNKILSNIEKIFPVDDRC
ncbi:MAG: hypothetical protein ACTSWY_02475 [Promethearchaeota archaeon]